jgi:regulator of replication initiation timing
MSDTANPEQQVTDPGQQVDWQARYNGQQAKLQQQAGTIQALTNEVGQRDQNIASLQAENTTLKAENARLQATQRKLETIRKLNRPDLIGVMEAIPVSEDAETMENAFKALAGYADSLVQARERQLMAGQTPTGGGSSAVATTPKPTSTEGWEQYVNSKPLGTPERQTAMDEWYAWMQALTTKP